MDVDVSLVCICVCVYLHVCVPLGTLGSVNCKQWIKMPAEGLQAITMPLIAACANCVVEHLWEHGHCKDYTHRFKHRAQVHT